MSAWPMMQKCEHSKSAIHAEIPQTRFDVRKGTPAIGLGKLPQRISR